MKTDKIIVNVKLWDTCIGKLQWDHNNHRSVFHFSDDYSEQVYDVCPVTHPKGKPLSSSFFGSVENLYQGLPEFIADALPDKWGNSLFDQWLTDNNVRVTESLPLLKLSYIGKRAMGALEFEPEYRKHIVDESIDMCALANLASRIYSDRSSAIISRKESLTLKRLIYLGTSAGGMRPKAVVAYNPGTEEFRSGQVSLPDGFKHYIIKFAESKDSASAEIEMVYHEMAKLAGITMMPCFLKAIDGQNHFVTERFDRKGNEKFFTQTLAAMSPKADDYAKLVWLTDRLKMSQEDKDQLFLRMVFNFVAGISDDHNKNFSFVMDRNGSWKLSPAYDVMFSANTWDNPSANIHCMGLMGKKSALTFQDFLDFGEDFVVDAQDKIRKVLNAVSHFESLCEKYNVERDIVAQIRNVLDTLVIDNVGI